MGLPSVEQIGHTLGRITYSVYTEYVDGYTKGYHFVDSLGESDKKISDVGKEVVGSVVSFAESTAVVGAAGALALASRLANKVMR